MHNHVNPVAEPNTPSHEGSESPRRPGYGEVALRYASVWDDNLKRRLDHLMNHLSTARACDVCRLPFSLERHCFTYSCDEGGLDLLYPNLYANICPACFDKAFRRKKSGSIGAHAKRLHALVQLLGRAPTGNFDCLTYQLHNGETILRYITLLQDMPRYDDYITEFGGLSAALRAAGIFRRRRCRTTIGTEMIARDGHCCLSCAEREIDDFLSAEGIEHNKEVPYPGSRRRADWELFGAPRRTFVECFGVTKNTAYAGRARIKAALAFAHGIELIAIHERIDWRSAIQKWREHQVNGG